MVTRTALRAAATMGRRAGAAFRDTGRPTLNPFRGRERLAELATAWRRAYFAELDRPRRR